MQPSGGSAANRPPIPPMAVLTFGIFAISISSILVRFAQGAAVPSLVIAAWRLTLATLILLPIAWARHRTELQGLHAAEWRPAIISGVMLAIHFAAWISSLDYTSIAASGVLVSTSPLWVALAAPILLQERIGRNTRIGVALALGGSLLIGLSELFGGSRVGSNPLLGNSLALLGAFCASAYLIIGRRLRVRLSLIAYITIVYGIAAITLMSVAILLGYPLFSYPPLLFGLFLLMALFPQLLGHSSFNYALGYLPTIYVTVTVISEPIGSSILALLVFREVPTVYTIIGGILILLGILFVSRQQPA